MLPGTWSINWAVWRTRKRKKKSAHIGKYERWIFLPRREKETTTIIIYLCGGNVNKMAVFPPFLNLISILNIGH